jgi:hypothetical protein
MIRLDRDSVASRSLGPDLAIVDTTILVVLLGRGAG